MSYSTELLPDAAEWVRKCRDKALRLRIERKIHQLGENPRPAGCVMLAGVQNRWRIRVGDYRIVYTILDDRLVVLIIEIDHRRDIYR